MPRAAWDALHDGPSRRCNAIIAASNKRFEAGGGDPQSNADNLKATAPCSLARLDAIFFHVPDPGGLRTQLPWPEPAQPEDAAARKAGNPSRREILAALARKLAETNAELRDATKARDGLEEATAEAVAKLIAGLETTQWNPEAAAPDRA